MELRNRTAFVTGGSRGVGRQLAIDLARRGVSVAVAARSARDLEETLRAAEKASPGGAEFAAFPCDVTDAVAVRGAVEAALGRLGCIDLLVCNAGVGIFRSPVDASLEEMRHVMEVNLWGAVHAVKAALPSMLARRSGRIVFVGSVGGTHGFPRQAAYSASKFALLGFADSLSLDLEQAGIGVTIVNPGPIDTPFFEAPGLEGLREVSRAHALPVERVSRAILRAVERDVYQLTIPRYMRWPGVARQLAPGLFRLGLRRFASHYGLLWMPPPEP